MICVGEGGERRVMFIVLSSIFDMAHHLHIYL